MLKLARTCQHACLKPKNLNEPSPQHQTQIASKLQEKGVASHGDFITSFSSGTGNDYGSSRNHVRQLQSSADSGLSSSHTVATSSHATTDAGAERLTTRLLQRGTVGPGCTALPFFALQTNICAGTVFKGHQWCKVRTQINKRSPDHHILVLAFLLQHLH